MTDNVWASPEFDDLRVGGDSRSGPKPKQRFKNQLRVLLLDLYVAWKEDTELAIGVSMRLGDYETSSRYNALYLSKVIPGLVHKLHEAGLVDLAKGSYAGPGKRGNRTTRIRAAELLAAVFEGQTLQLDELEAVEGQETIILRDASNKPIPYTDIAATLGWRAELAEYNTLLRRSFIDIPSLDQPFVERDITLGERAGQVQRIRLAKRDVTVRRVFSRSDWMMNGRFYGGWWQHIGKDHRQQIYINDRPTVEIDFRGLHVAILSKEQGIKIEGDPYLLPDGLVEGVGPDYQRAFVKHLVLTAVNAKNLKQAYQAFRENFATGHIGKTLTNTQLKTLLFAFVERHPHLRDALGADQGIRLMNIDAEIARAVINHFTERNIPVLCIHDSFIIDVAHADELNTLMQDTTASYLGAPFETSTLPGIHFWDPVYLGSDVPTNRVAVTEGYRQRLERFEDWLREVG